MRLNINEMKSKLKNVLVPVGSTVTVVFLGGLFWGHPEPAQWVEQMYLALAASSFAYGILTTVGMGGKSLKAVLGNSIVALFTMVGLLGLFTLAATMNFSSALSAALSPQTFMQYAGLGLVVAFLTSLFKSQ